MAALSKVELWWSKLFAAFAAKVREREEALARRHQEPGQRSDADGHATTTTTTITNDDEDEVCKGDKRIGVLGVNE